MDLNGIIPAAILPFKENGSIDESAFIQHLNDLAAVEGVKAIAVNGHAGEVHSLTNDEKSNVVRIAKKTIDIPVISGIGAEGNLEAVEQARQMEDAGADALLVMPPHGWGIYGKLEPDMPMNFYKDLISAVKTPLLIFQYRAWSPASYSINTLLEITSLPGVIGMKCAVNDLTRHEFEYKKIKQKYPEFAFLTAHDKHLLISFVLGCDGALVGFAALTPKPIVQMFEAVKNNDLQKAKELHENLARLRDFIYKEPFGLCHSRIKQVLFMLGKIPSAEVRGPLVKVSFDEIKELESILTEGKNNGVF